MKLETFFEKFELFADAPNAVAKMRELILQLAAHGRLVDQSHGDESASDLLTRIHAHFALLRSRKEMRGPSIEPLNVDELPSIPKNWEWVRLGNVVDYGSSEKSESADIPEDAWLLDLEDIEKDTSRLLQRKVFRDSPSKSTKTTFVAGDVLYGKLRPYLNKVLVADEPGYCTTEIIPIRTFGFIDPAYLCYALKRPEFLAYANSKSYGMNLPRLGTEDARRAAFPLPPLAEQKRIVAKVDELMALCDRLEAQQQERDTRHAALARASLFRFAEAPTPANLDFLFHKSYRITPADLRKSILTLAVQGKLVPQDPDDEPAAELLRRIDSEKEALIKGKKIRRQEVPGPIRDEDIPFAIPDGWEWRRLADVCFLITDGAHHTPAYQDTGVPFLSVKDVSGGQIDFSRTRFISEEQHRELCKRCRPEFGDILLTKVGTTGIAVTIEEKREFSIFVSLALLKFSQPNLDRLYLKHLINSPFVRQQSAENTQGIGNKNLVLRLINQFTVPIPPLAEQRRIVAKVDQLMALVDQLETQLSEAKIKSAALLDAVIHEFLNPTAEIIDLASYRAAVGCYAISKMQGKRYFGRTAAMKVLYLAQAHVGLELGLKPMREAAGPFDSWLYRFEEQGEREAWFKVVDSMTAGSKKKIEYRPGRALAEQSAQAERAFTADQRKEFDRLLTLFSDRTTEEAEIIATLFAAWNDFLIDGHEPSDDEIVREVRENWHEKKGRFTPVLLRKWLGWLRQNGLIPRGRLPRTTHQTQLLLN